MYLITRNNILVFLEIDGEDGEDIKLSHKDRIGRFWALYLLLAIFGLGLLILGYHYRQALYCCGRHVVTRRQP